MQRHVTHDEDLGIGGTISYDSFTYHTLPLAIWNAFGSLSKPTALSFSSLAAVNTTPEPQNQV